MRSVETGYFSPSRWLTGWLRARRGRDQQLDFAEFPKRPSQFSKFFSVSSKGGVSWRLGSNQG